MLALAWVSLLLAGSAIGAVLTNAPAGWDASVVADLHGAPHGALTAVMRAITWLGSPVVLDAVFAAALVALLALRSWRDALFLALASPGTVVMVQLIKLAVERARPAGAHLTPSEGSSWPSGHASSSTALFAGLLLIFLSTGLGARIRARRAMQILVAALLVLVGISRIYLGVHYPTDVIGAWLLVVGWLTALERTLGHSRTRGQPS